ncbi:MAG: GMC family oxidoreductase [Gemmatimonadaceae bacterium]|nr:GMC family oxidoreductase [Gemmatimonadaceae bacterium]
MHIDAQTLENGAEIEGDVCIVGAGAAGISLAMEFVRSSRHRVLLLEGGGFDLEAPVQALYRGEIVGRPYYPLESARLHYFGGTTGHWGGYCAPLDPIDFTARSWVPNSGWPFTHQTLDPFYARAHPILDLGPYDYRPASWQVRDARRVSLPFDRTVVDDKIWQFSPPTRFGSKYRAAIVSAPQVHLYTHANVVEIECNESATVVESLRIRQRDGREQRVRATHVVLACSTMQNIRLLLSSHGRAAAGVGNTHDMVGRYFLEHLEMPTGRAAIVKPQSMFLYGFDFGVTKARAELRLTDATQERLGVLNATLACEPASEEGDDTLSTFEIEQPESVEQFRRETRDSLSADMRSPARSFDAAFVARKPLFSLFTRQEQAPNPRSRVTLSRDRDALGVPQARFDWQLTPLDKRTMRETTVALAQQFGRSGVGRVQIRPWLLKGDEEWPAMVSGGWHDMGGTRMHTDPKQGVVDVDCRVHGVANLHLAGAGVFPTAGSANPTLSIVALAIRLADRLRVLLEAP